MATNEVVEERKSSLKTLDSHTVDNYSDLELFNLLNRTQLALWLPLHNEIVKYEPIFEILDLLDIDNSLMLLSIWLRYLKKITNSIDIDGAAQDITALRAYGDYYSSQESLYNLVSRTSEFVQGLFDLYEYVVDQPEFNENDSESVVLIIQCFVSSYHLDTKGAREVTVEDLKKLLSESIDHGRQNKDYLIELWSTFYDGVLHLNITEPIHSEFSRMYTEIHDEIVFYRTFIEDLDLPEKKPYVNSGRVRDYLYHLTASRLYDSLEQLSHRWVMASDEDEIQVFEKITLLNLISVIDVFISNCPIAIQPRPRESKFPLKNIFNLHAHFTIACSSDEALELPPIAQEWFSNIVDYQNELYSMVEAYIYLTGREEISLPYIHSYIRAIGYNDPVYTIEGLKEQDPSDKVGHMYEIITKAIENYERILEVSQAEEDAGVVVKEVIDDVSTGEEAASNQGVQPATQEPIFEDEIKLYEIKDIIELLHSSKLFSAVDPSIFRSIVNQKKKINSLYFVFQNLILKIQTYEKIFANTRFLHTDHSPKPYHKLSNIVFHSSELNLKKPCTKKDQSYHNSSFKQVIRWRLTEGVRIMVGLDPDTGKLVIAEIDNDHP